MNPLSEAASPGVDPGDGHCYHCAGPLPAGQAWQAWIAGAERAMCCPGCAAVANLIESTGMSGYYRARSAPARSQAPAPPHPGAEALPESIALALFDDPALQPAFVSVAADGALEAHLQLHHLRCGACTWLIEGQLRRQPGVLAVQVNTAAGRMVLRWDPARSPLSRLIEALRGIGYDASPWQAGIQDARSQRERRRRLAEMVVAGLGMMQVMMYAYPIYIASSGEMSSGETRLMNWAGLVLTLPVMLFSAQGIFRNAWRGLIAGRLGMDVPVAVGLLAAFGGSLWSLWQGQGPVWFDSVTMFVFLLLASRWLEQAVRERALALTARLAPAVPAQALRLQGGEGVVVPVPVVGLRAGDHIRIPVGEVIPVDGRILGAGGPVAEALLTGESTPAWRGAGDAVLAGSLNLGEVLDVEVVAVGAESTLARILRRMDQAVAERAPIASLADAAAARFVAALLLITLCAAAVWCWVAPARALAVAIAVLVVSCPCALSLAVPATLAASTARLARRGLLLLDGQALEILGRARTFVFDKTGTLTMGRPELEVDGLEGPLRRQQALASVATALEAQQSHPYARAVCAALAERFPVLGVPRLEQRRTCLGAGVEGVIDGEVWRIGTRAFVAELSADAPATQRPVSTPQMLAAQLAQTAQGEAWLGNAQGLQLRFRFTDALRPGAAELLRSLRDQGARVVLLSGDHPAAVDALARQLGIAEARGGLSPEDKLAGIRALQADAPVVMVGDGLNDAPGFGAASLAIAVGRVTESLARGAGAIVPDGDLSSLAAAITESRGALRRIRQNLGWALAYNLCAIPLAAGGWLTPWEAGLGMSLSSLLVVMNGMRPWSS